MAGRVSFLLGSALVGLSLAAGCARSEWVEARIVLPARVPVAIFPVIYVVAADGPESGLVAARVVESLRRDGAADVRPVAASELGLLRARGGLPPSSVALRVAFQSVERYRSQLTSMPSTSCGPTGCYTVSSTQSYDVPVLEAHIAITVVDGPTGNVLQQEMVEHLEEGRSWERMRELAATRLVDRVLPMLRQEERTERVELLEIDLDGVGLALEHARRGSWREARAILERLARSGEASALDPSDRARLLYDLALARRFDVRADVDLDRHFRDAEQALRGAIAIDPKPRYGEALRALEADYENARLLREQRAAAAFYARQARVPSVPAPPEGYGAVPPP